jgi:curli biogenesis system outer membrane secretion channel CsgG
MRKILTMVLSIFSLIISFPHLSSAAGKNTIAVVDFTNNASASVPYQIERMANDVLSILLAQTGKFRVLERNKVDSLMRELSFNKSEWVNPQKAMKMGKLLGAEYIATGSITELGSEAKAFTGYGINTKNVVYNVSIEIKIIETEKGEIIFGDLTSDSNMVQQSNNLTTYAGEEVYRKLLKNALAKSVNKLVASLSGTPTQRNSGQGNHRITIISTPNGASIEIGGAMVGSTPANLTLSDGIHQVRIFKPGYRPWEKSIHVSDGMQIKVNLIGEGFQQK